MITIIVGTDRSNSKSGILGAIIERNLKELGHNVALLSMGQLPADTLSNISYSRDKQSEGVAKLQDKYILPADKFVFIIPEYNGSFPGILKCFLDAISVRKYKENFHNKKAVIIGLASGRLGNAIGAQHLNSILNYLGVHTYPEKLYLAGIDSKFEDDKYTNQAELDLLNEMLKNFLSA